MIRLFDNFTLITYCAMIFWLSGRESVPTVDLFPHIDKLYHAAAYLLMGVLAWRCFNHYINSTVLHAIASILFCSLYGLSDEWHQSFVYGRYADINDWLADFIGVLTGVGIMTIRHKRLQFRGLIADQK